MAEQVAVGGLLERTVTEDQDVFAGGQRGGRPAIFQDMACGAIFQDMAYGAIRRSRSRRIAVGRIAELPIP